MERWITIHCHLTRVTDNDEVVIVVDDVIQYLYCNPQPSLFPELKKIMQKQIPSYISLQTCS